jgi:diacylglycerol kinase family enzyme
MVDYFEAESVEVESDQPLDVQLDGDLRGTTPARFRIRPRALRIRVPS